MQPQLSLNLRGKYPDSSMLIAPSNHSVANVSAFRKAVNDGKITSDKGNLFTFGIKPDRAETGYGYLELKTKLAIPSSTDARAMLKSGNYLWAGLIPSEVKRLKRPRR